MIHVSSSIGLFDMKEVARLVICQLLMEMEIRYRVLGCFKRMLNLRTNVAVWNTMQFMCNQVLHRIHVLSIRIGGNQFTIVMTCFLSYKGMHKDGSISWNVDGHERSAQCSYRVCPYDLWVSSYLATADFVTEKLLWSIYLALLTEHFWQKKLYMVLVD